MAKDNGYFFDLSSFSFRRATRSVWKLLYNAFLYMLVVLALTVVAYLAFSLVVRTDSERKLHRENRIYERLLPDLDAREALLGDVVAGLQHKDNEIYLKVFNSEAPSVDPFNSLSFLFGNDTIPDIRLVRYTKNKSNALLKKSERVEENFRNILLTVAAGDSVTPPMQMPLKGITYSQIGASVGSRLNYNIKTNVQHDGLDIIAPRGQAVYAPADAVVLSVTRSNKGQGNVIELQHEGGYVTRYAHLSEMNVSKGDKISKGRKIGGVGMSGSAFAPHLHYEVLRYGQHVDPVNYMFATVGPNDYANMLFMAANTAQSMD